MRRLRNEIPSLIAVLTLPAVAIFAFPWSTLSFHPNVPSTTKSTFVAFVTLTSEQEDLVLRRAKTTSGETAGGVVSHADLILGALPDDPPRPVARIEDREHPTAPSRRAWTPGAWLPSQAALRPAPLTSDDARAPSLPFPRDELLRLDGNDASAIK